MGWIKDIRDTRRGVRNATREVNTAWMREPQTQADRTANYRELQAMKRMRRTAVLGQGRTRQAEKEARGRP
jgi:hypothetical protein